MKIYCAVPAASELVGISQRIVNNPVINPIGAKALENCLVGSTIKLNGNIKPINGHISSKIALDKIQEPSRVVGSYPEAMLSYNCFQASANLKPISQAMTNKPRPNHKK